VREDLKYLLHILECIRRIDEDVAEGKASFHASHTVQDAVLRNLQVIAESTKRLSATLKDDHTEIDWSGIAGFRNFLVHDYLGVDLGVVWDIVSRDVPALGRTISAILHNQQA
jgi:uncharacterized protein with HEPN domain